MICREMDAGGTFPSKTGSETRSNFEQGTCCRSFLMTEKNNGWCNIFWFKLGNLTLVGRIVFRYYHFLRHNCPCHRLFQRSVQ